MTVDTTSYKIVLNGIPQGPKPKVVFATTTQKTRSNGYDNTEKNTVHTGVGIENVQTALCPYSDDNWSNLCPTKR